MVDQTVSHMLGNCMAAKPYPWLRPSDQKVQQVKESATTWWPELDTRGHIEGEN